MADDALARTAASGHAEVIRLWPDGPPTALADPGPEVAYRSPAAGGLETTMLRNVSDPTLTVFRPRPGSANGTGVIVAPGGGWRILAWEHEGLDIATWLAARGCTAFLLKYRVAATDPDPVKFAAAMAAMSAPLSQSPSTAKLERALERMMSDETISAARRAAGDDGRKALALVRERAQAWALDPDRIGVTGFSAGAFLAVDVTLEPGGRGPAFVAPIYGGSTGGRAPPPEAPPLFACIAQDDRFLIRMVEQLYRDWSEAGRPAELHVFARGGHGFGSVKRGLPVDGWMDLFGAWLADQGFA